jgi:hypothetical protein
LVNPIFILLASIASLQYVALSQVAFGLIGYWMYWRFMLYKMIRISFAAYFRSISKELVSASVACALVYIVSYYIHSFPSAFITLVIYAIFFISVYLFCSILINRRGIVLISDIFQLSEKLGYFPNLQFRLKRYLNG